MLDSSNKMDNIIMMGYDEVLNRLCDDLDISLHQETIVSNPYDLYTKSKSTISEYNMKPDITGILYDCPFMYDKFENTIQSNILPSKDMECITPINMGMYVTKQQYNTLPPITSSIELLISEFMQPELNRIGVIQPVGKFSNKFIPINNIDINTYILSTIKDDTFIDLDMASLNVIISGMFNSHTRINSEMMSWAGTLHAKLAIDYGWRTISGTPSINSEIFTSDTIHLTLYDGLIELYVYNAINNMIRLYKFHNM